MIEFSGFPDKTRYSPLPNIFFSELLPEISDLTELKVTLYALVTLYQKRGYPRHVTRDEFLSNLSLRKCLKDAAELDKALDTAVNRGTLLRLKGDGEGRDIYLLNTPADREAAGKIREGELKLPDFTKAPEASAPVPEIVEDIFSLYEENIGQLTPLVADWLKEAEGLYPETWLRDAIKEAAKAGIRNWRYIARILEHWQTEGKTDGAYQRYLKTQPDPDKYIRGKYGHIVQR